MTSKSQMIFGVIFLRVFLSRRESIWYTLFFYGEICCGMMEKKGGEKMEVLKFPEIRLKKDKAVYQLPIDKIRSNPYQPIWKKYHER